MLAISTLEPFVVDSGLTRDQAWRLRVYIILLQLHRIRQSSINFINSITVDDLYRTLQLGLVSVETANFRFAGCWLCHIRDALLADVERFFSRINSGDVVC